MIIDKIDAFLDLDESVDFSRGSANAIEHLWQKYNGNRDKMASYLKRKLSSVKKKGDARMISKVQNAYDRFFEKGEHKSDMYDDMPDKNDSRWSNSPNYKGK